MRKLKSRTFGVIFISISFLFLGTAEAERFINPFLCRIGGNTFYSGDEVKLARYDIIFMQKFLYEAINRDTWQAVKNINPNAKIYTYTQINNVYRTTDSTEIKYLNNLGRYNISRGHSMGSLNGSHPEFFLTDVNGNRVTANDSTSNYFLDFGNSSFRNYSIEAIRADNINQPWTADGVYSDHCTAIISDVASTPSKYDTNTKWVTAMNGMLNAMTAALNARGQGLACNRGGSALADGYDAWQALDAGSSPPDVLLEEGAFAVSWGPSDIQFYPEDKWKRQVDILASIKNSNVCFMSHTDLSEGGSGTDNYGMSFSYWDALWYSMGSYLLGKNDNLDNSYFMFRDSRSYNCIDYYFNEYDKIDLGVAAGGYKVTNYSGTNIYWREFADGYVYVNPTHKNVTSISLPEACKLLTHSNFTRDLSTLQNINTISLNGHRVAVLYKSNPSSSTYIGPPIDLKVVN